MEENPIAPTPPPPVIVKKNNNIPLIGAIIFLALTIAAAAIYLGTRNLNETDEIAATISPTPSAPTSNQLSPTPVLVTTSPLQAQSVTKLKDSSFSSYAIEFPPSWTQKLEENGTTSTFTLTRSTDEIKIYQAPMGGGLCVFEGEMPENFGTDYRDSEYVEIQTIKTALRRIVPAQETGKVTYSFCGNNLEVPDTFTTPTLYGVITYTITDPTPEKLTEMDNILKSIK